MPALISIYKAFDYLRLYAFYSFSIPTFFLSDIVVNNAGILRDKSFVRIKDEDWGE